MRFGIFYEHQLPRPWGPDDEYTLLQNALEQIELADKIGLEYVWEVEHHFLEEYSHSSAPEVFLAACSQRTKNIRLGQGIRQVIPQYNHPARTAEVIATLDLHANVSERMVSEPDVLISYITNPHVDAYERGQEAADCMIEMFGGVTAKMASIRIPLVAPSVTLLTAEGHPYGDLIRLGQSKLGDDIMNVSITAGFAFSDTDRNGMTITVTAREDQAKADALAREGIPF